MKMKEEVGAEGKKGSLRKEKEQEEMNEAWGKKRSLRSKEEQKERAETLRLD